MPAGTTLVAFETITLDGKAVASHHDLRDANQTVTVRSVPKPQPVVVAPAITTKAFDPVDGDQVLPTAGGDVVDTVTFKGLTAGERYVIKGTLMDRESGKSIGSTSQLSFQAATDTDSVDMFFRVPAGVQSKALVAFEELTRADGTLVAVHEDITAASQTVTLAQPSATSSASPSAPAPSASAPAPKPSASDPAPAPSATETASKVTMTGTAVDKRDHDKVIAASGGTVLAEATMDGLSVGSSYVLNAQLMDKASRTPVGSAVAVSFKATAPHAVARVEIPVGLQQSGRTLVVVEKLTLNGAQVAASEDLESAAQTVVVEAPEPVATEPPAPVPSPPAGSTVVPTASATPAPSDSAVPTASASPAPQGTQAPSSTETVPSAVDQPAVQGELGLASTGSALEGTGLLGATGLVAGGAWVARRRR